MCWMDIRRDGDALRASIEAVREHEPENGHSWGWAAILDGEITVEHGLGEIPDDVWVPETDAALCHTRFATMGEVTLGNAHPFPVTVGGETVAALAHNGTWYDAPTVGDWSDSRAMAGELEISLKAGIDFPHAFAELGQRTGETIIALRQDGSCWIHSGRFPITCSDTAAASSGHERSLPDGVHVL